MGGHGGHGWARRTGGHVPTLPRPCWVMGFAQIRSFFLGGGGGGVGEMEDGLGKKFA